MVIEAVGGGFMTSLALVLLAIIAIATTFMAILQIGAILYVRRLGRRVDDLAGEFKRELKPLVGRLNTMKDVVINQAREELGLIEGLRTAFESMKKTFQKSQPPPPATRNTEDEDSMFIG